MNLLLGRWLVLGLTACVCVGVQVTVRPEKRYAMLFQSAVLQCQYQTRSTQTPVVQWWYKSYCRDRTKDSFTFSESLGAHGSALGTAAQMECSDAGRTVRIIASGQGASMTLAEHYKGRDIAIVNKADLKIGGLQWGDSGVYFCKIVISDDLEGKDEGQVELLVLGRTGVLDDLLPEFDVEIMPEWVFVGSVVLGSILFLVLMGICWCQCCPYSCCCYLRCCCCPETCCCPRHLYEAGKLAKSGQSPQMPVYPPYYIPGIPTMIPFAPPSLSDPKMVPIPSVENNLAGGASVSTVPSCYHLRPSQSQDPMKVLYYLKKELGHVPSSKMTPWQSSSLSELSSLHEGGDTDFRQNYRTVQMKALPAIADLELGQSELTAAPVHNSRRPRHCRGNHSDEDENSRWNSRSVHLERRTLGSRGRTGSLDELEEFAMSYGPRARRCESRAQDLELRGPEDYPSYQGHSPPRHFHGNRNDDWPRGSPPPSPHKRRDTWDNECDRPSRPQQPADRGRSYDDAFLNELLERKLRGGAGERCERGKGRGDDDSDTPSKGSSRGKGSDGFYSRSSSNRPEEEDSLPPYSEMEAERYRKAHPAAERYLTVDPLAERYRTTEPFSYTRPAKGGAHTIQPGRENRDKNRNMTTAPGRDSLIV